MLILGIANNDTAGACLVKNSKILSAVHEEPIINTLKQAASVLKEKIIDVIIINDSYALIRREDV